MQQKELYGEISAFMDRLRDDPSHESITNMQGAIDYLLEKLHIVTEVVSVILRTFVFD